MTDKPALRRLYNLIEETRAVGSIDQDRINGMLTAVILELDRRLDAVERDLIAVKANRDDRT